MDPKPTLTQRQRKNLAALGVGQMGEPQIPSRPRDKTHERDVRSSNHINQPKKDTIMETATHKHTHVETTNAAVEEPSPARVGQQMDRAAKQLDRLEDAMIVETRPANIAVRSAAQFAGVVLAVVAGEALYSWLFKPKTLEISPLTGMKK